MQKAMSSRNTYFCMRLPSIWAAATTALCSVVTAGGSQQTCISGSSRTASTEAAAVPTYPLVEKWRQSNDSWLLRFALPPERKYLGDDPTLPTCISVHHNTTSTTAEADSVSSTGRLLKKSYSPVSHPATVGFFDLLVKSYPPRPGGGVGAAICSLQPGQLLTGKLKAERLVHGSPRISRRWDRIGLVAGGTGVAPLVQIIRIILSDPDDNTKIQLLSINRYEEDILMRAELEQMARDHPDRFSVSYSLTGRNIPEDWNGFKGRGSVDMAQQALPPPSSSGDGRGSTMIFVCGTDGFRDMWAGPIVRGPPKADGTKGPKIQGPLLGILKDAGYKSSDVFKY